MISPAAFNWTTLAKAGSKSRSLLAFNTWSRSPRLRAASCASRTKGSASAGPVGSTSTAKSVAVGSNACSTSNRFGTISTFKLVTPVRFPPGRFRLSTNPTLIGSTATANTIGIVVVAALAATAPGVPLAATITFTRRWTRSAASAGNRLTTSCAQRYSIATFWPSTYPASFNPSRNTPKRIAYRSGDDVPRNPITGIADCCARTASGRAAATPARNVMNSRRLIR